MNKSQSRLIKRSALWRKSILWGGGLALVIIGLATAQTGLPVISLNSPTSFPIDI